MNKTIFLLALCSVIFFSGYSLAENNRTDETALAVIGGSTVTVEKFKSEMERRGHNMSGNFTSLHQKNALLEEMVRTELIYAAAIDAGYDRKPEVLAAVKRIITSKFWEDGISSEFLKIKTDDIEIEAYYRQHPEKYMVPQMIRWAVIQIAVPQKATDEKKSELFKRAELARAEALKFDPETLSFGPVAVNYSDDQVTRYRGGETGAITTKENNTYWDKEVIEALFSLKTPGEISPVITAPTGFYILKLMDIKESELKPLEEVKEMIRYQILTDKKIKTEQDFLEKLKSKISVSVNNDLLEKIESPGAGVKLAPPALPGR